jgi:hypothetical protein
MNNSRSSRGSPLTGATFGSTSPRSIFDRTVLADPCSPEMAKTGYGPLGRSAAKSRETTRTKSFWLDRLNKQVSSSSDPPRCGSGSGRRPVLRWKRTGGQRTTRHPSGPISYGTPVFIGEIKIDATRILGEADMNGTLRSVKLRARFSKSSSEEIACPFSRPAPEAS